MTDEQTNETIVSLLQFVVERAPGPRKPIKLWDWAERNGYEPQEVADAVDALGCLYRGSTAMVVWYDDIQTCAGILARRRNRP